MFAYDFAGKRTPFALIQPMDIPTNVLSRKDKHFHLYRVHARTRRDCIFVPLDSIVRGALLVRDQGVQNDYLVVDVVDTDWFLRCRELFANRITW